MHILIDLFGCKPIHEASLDDLGADVRVSLDEDTARAWVDMLELYGSVTPAEAVESVRAAFDADYADYQVIDRGTNIAAPRGGKHPNGKPGIPPAPWWRTGRPAPEPEQVSRPVERPLGEQTP
jgi:hypothetical protein